MHLRKYIVLIIFLWSTFLWTTHITAQEYLFESELLTTDHGLANLMTYSAYKDSKGFIWVATKYGLNRYDGYNFRLYTKEQNGLNQNAYIRSIKEDDSGNLWLFSQSENTYTLTIFDTKKEKVIPTQSYFKQELPFDPKELAFLKVSNIQNQIWVSTQKGQLYIYQNGSFKQIFKKNGFSPEYLTSDQEGNIWVGGEKEVLQIDSFGKILETIILEQPLHEMGYSKEDNILWLVTKKWINSKSSIQSSIWQKKKNSPNIESLQFTKNNESILIKNAFRGQNGFWYVNIENHIELFNSKGIYISDLHNSVGKRIETGFLNYLNSEDYSWLVTPIGIIKSSIKQNPFDIIHKREMFSNCRGITEDEVGNIYFLNRHLFQWNPIKNKLKKYPSFNGSLALLQHHNLIWGGVIHEHYMGLELDLKTNETKLYESVNSKIPYALLESKKTGIYFLGQENGISFLDLNQKRIFPFEKYNEFDLLKKSKVFFFHKNEAGIWTATDNGIFLLSEKNGALKHFDKNKGDLPFDYIRHIYEDTSGIFWLSTSGGGIIRWQPSLESHIPSKSTQFTTKDGLSNNHIYAMYGDSYGYLWISSDRGLMQMNTTNNQIKTYSVKDGLPHNEFNLTSHYQAKDSTLYFGGLGGLIAFHPKDFAKESKNQTALVFTHYNLLENKAKEFTDKTDLLRQSNKITFKPSDKLIELKFALLDFDATTKHNYAYKIEGYMESWVRINENFIQITDLPYGNYTLKIKGQNGSNGWSENQLALEIQVPKPFYLRWWFLMLSLIALIASIYMYIKNRIIKLEKNKEQLEKEVLKRTETIHQQAEALKALDIEKTRFFSNVTHEFRTPLTLIIGPVQQLIKKQPPPIIYERRMNGILKNAQHLLDLINQMLDLSKLEGGQMKIEIIRGDIIQYTQELVERFRPLTSNKNQQLSFISSLKNWETHFDKEKWDKIIYNLLANAIKFTPKNEIIQMSLIKCKKNKKDYIRLDVKDTGMGIEEKQLGQIFNRFYQVDSSSTRMKNGTGIGLALVKELIEIQGGEIWVSSKVNKGTSFEIYLPIIEPEIEIPSQILKSPNLPFPIPLEKENIILPQTLSHQLELLIIEDNEDMREYIRYCVDHSKYNITEAKNGEEGILKAQTIIPDLIISDVMMPKKNGFEVVQEIRNNIITSHIPIILLTAKSSLESRLEGLEHGADVYLTKPFSPQELTLRIHKLIEIRQILQQRYYNSGSFTENKSFKKEDDFILELKTHILKNIDQSNLNGDNIGRHFGMSRVHLYRKLKALTNLPISEFVKKIRLEKAKELILERELNISEITYQTGFSSISYFSRTFKKTYGKKPSEM